MIGRTFNKGLWAGSFYAAGKLERQGELFWTDRVVAQALLLRLSGGAGERRRADWFAQTGEGRLWAVAECITPKAKY